MDTDEQEKRAKIVSQVFGGIQPPFEAFYIHSIIYSTTRCLDAYRRYDLEIERGAAADVLIGAVQEAIGHAGALSRYFWPARIVNSKQRPFFSAMVTDRAAKLRVAFEVNNTSPLAQRQIRNTWEHFDEKLDAFLLKTSAGNFFPAPVVARLSKETDPVNHYFKLLDPDAERMILLGESYQFGQIRTQVTRIHGLALEAEARGGRLALNK